MKESDRNIIRTLATTGAATLLAGCNPQTVEKTIIIIDKAAIPVAVVSVAGLVTAAVAATKGILNEQKKEKNRIETEKYIQDYQSEFKE